MKKIHIGCGMNAPHSFENFDASPTLRFERLPIIGKLYTKNATRFPENAKYGNIVNGVDVGKNSADAVYCSHVLEHLSKEEFYIALKNIYSYLKVGGVFRMIMPDLHSYAKQYLNDYSEQLDDSSIKFMNSTLLGIEEERKRGLLYILKNGLSNSRHIWLWDDNSTKKALEDIGFKSINKCSFQESSVDYFNDIEQEGSFNNAFCLECIK